MSTCDFSGLKCEFLLHRYDNVHCKNDPDDICLGVCFSSQEPMSIIELNINVDVALGDQVLKICDQIAHQCVNVYSTVL